MERRVGFGRVQWLVGLVAVATALTWAIGAIASPNGGTIGTYTGCLDAKGNITEVAGGTQPLSPCKGTKSQIIRISGGDISSVETPAGGGLRGGADDSAVSLSLAPIPAARVRSATIISVPDNNVVTMVPFDTVEFDTAALFNPVNSTMLVAPVAGVYTVSGHVTWSLSPLVSVSRLACIEANIGIVYQAVACSSLSAGGTDQTFSTIVRLSAGDYVQLEVEQMSGNTDSLTVSDHAPTLTMAWLGPAI
jgi:hypothetical protein